MSANLNTDTTNAREEVETDKDELRQEEIEGEGSSCCSTEEEERFMVCLLLIMITTSITIISKLLTKISKTC